MSAFHNQIKSRSQLSSTISTEDVVSEDLTLFDAIKLAAYQIFAVVSWPYIKSWEIFTSFIYIFFAPLKITTLFMYATILSLQICLQILKNMYLDYQGYGKQSYSKGTNPQLKSYSHDVVPSTATKEVSSTVTKNSNTSSSYLTKNEHNGGGNGGDGLINDPNNEELPKQNSNVDEQQPEETIEADETSKENSDFDEQNFEEATGVDETDKKSSETAEITEPISYW